MKKYFYSDGLAKHGPYTLEELKNQNITRKTMVWFHPMDDWRAAGELSELQELFVMEPPDRSYAAGTRRERRDEYFPVEGRPPRSWLVESILVTLFCCMPFGIAGIVHAAKVESRYSFGDLEGAKRSSEEAGKWTKIGFWIGIAGIMLYFVFLGFGIVFNL